MLDVIYVNFNIKNKIKVNFNRKSKEICIDEWFFSKKNYLFFNLKRKEPIMIGKPQFRTQSSEVARAIVGSEW